MDTIANTAANWSHPTGKSPKTVNFICLGASHQAYIASQLDKDPDPILTDMDETWTLNRGIGVFPHDLLFVMDHIGGEAAQYPRYGARLWRHDRPIITSDNCMGWPSHVFAYPWGDIQGWLRAHVRPTHGDWFHNSLAYILVYAAFIGVQELRVWGADYKAHNNGYVEDGHPNVAYWAGVLERVGLNIKVESSSSFLNANQRHWLYGYQTDPRYRQERETLFYSLVDKHKG